MEDRIDAAVARCFKEAMRDLVDTRACRYSGLGACIVY